MEIQNTPILSGPAPRNALRTAKKLSSFALRHTGSIQSQKGIRRYLDIGCGNGFITEHVAKNFNEVVGIDVEKHRLEEFRSNVANNPKYRIFEMSADRIDFPENHFPFITLFEVLEHVANLEASAGEIVRVCDRGGVVVISVPQVWYPFENHGIRSGRRVYERKIPLLPYIRPLHRKYALARVFSSHELDKLFVSRGLQLLETSYVSPQLERAAAKRGSWESMFVFLRPLFNRCENVPLLRVLTGVSMLKAYRKV